MSIYRQVIANILSIVDASFNCGDASDMDHLLGDSWNGETENCFMPTASRFAVSLKIDGSESPQIEVLWLVKPPSPGVIPAHQRSLGWISHDSHPNSLDEAPLMSKGRTMTGWWFQPIWKIMKNISQIWSFPQVRVKIKHIWNHQPDNHHCSESSQNSTKNLQKILMKTSSDDRRLVKSQVTASATAKGINP